MKYGKLPEVKDATYYLAGMWAQFASAVLSYGHASDTAAKMADEMMKEFEKRFIEEEKR